MSVADEVVEFLGALEAAKSYLGGNSVQLGCDSVVVCVRDYMYTA